MTPRARRPLSHLGRALVVLGALAALGIGLIRYTGLQEYGFRMMGVAGASVAAGAVAAAVALLGALALLVAGASPPDRLVRQLAPTVVPVALVLHMTAPAVQGVLAPERARTGAPFSVLTQNLYFLNEDPDGTFDEVLSADADVLVLTEFTPGFEELLDTRPDAERVAATYLHQWRRAEPEGSGLAVLSRLPITDVVPVPLSAPAVVVGLEVAGERVELYAVHPMAPSDRWGLLQWQHDYRVLVADAEDAGPQTVMAGDFNASTGHRAFRRLLDRGDLRDAHDVGGGGVIGTWPVTRWMPELMRLDHVLVGRGVGVERFELLARTGADHRGVVAWLRVGRS